MTRFPLPRREGSRIAAILIAVAGSTSFAQSQNSPDAGAGTIVMVPDAATVTIQPAGADGGTDTLTAQIADVNAIEELAIEELLKIDSVVTATKVEQSVEEAPAIVEVINAGEIRRRGLRTVADALSHVAGLHVIDDHLYYDVGVRGVFSSPGAANDIIKVMINGQPISFRSTSISFLGHDLIPIEAVERIEIVRGPASALYGANAFLGVVNIITYRGGANEELRHPAHSVALDGYYRQDNVSGKLNGSVSMYSGHDFERLSYFVTGTYHTEDRSGLEVPGLQDLIRDRMNRTSPEFFAEPDDAPSPGWDQLARQYMLSNPVSQNDRERTGSFYGLLSYKHPAEIAVELDGHLQYFDRYAEFQYFSFLTHGTRLTHLNGYLRGSLTYGAEREEGLALRLSVALAGGAPTEDDRIVDRLVSGTYKRRQIGYRAWDVSAEAMYRFTGKSSVSFGADYTNDRERLLGLDVINERTGRVTEEALRPYRTFANVGAYGQWMWNILDGLSLTVGSRVDHNTAIACNAAVWNCLGTLEDVTIPAAAPGERDILIDQRGLLQLSNRAALVYALPFGGLYTKLIYGSSFKPPSPFQLHHPQLTVSGSSVGNPSLKPQTADTVEALIGSRPIPELRMSVVGYGTRVNGAVVFLKEGARLEARNADLEVTGLEASVAYTLQKSVSVFANTGIVLSNRLQPQQKRDETDSTWEYSALNTVVHSGRYPDLMVNAGVNLHPPESGYNVNVTGRYVGARRATLVNNQLHNRLDFENSYELPPYLIVDATISSVGLRLLPFTRGESIISASVTNAAGGYSEPGYGGIDIPAMGPRLFLRFEQQF